MEHSYRVRSKEEELIENVINKIVQTLFDLGKLLLRIKLLKLAEDSHILLINTHHIVSDRLSIGVFLRKITTLYQAFLREKIIIRELPI